MENAEFRQMMKVRIYRWTVRLIKYLRILSKRNERIVWTIVDQLSRSGTSMGANYVEAIGAPTQKDFRNFLAYALKSGNESKYWLALIRDSGIDKSDELNPYGSIPRRLRRPIMIYSMHEHIYPQES